MARKMPERKEAILNTLRSYPEFSLREIAEVYGVTESRICQVAQFLTTEEKQQRRDAKTWKHEGERTRVENYIRENPSLFPHEVAAAIGLPVRVVNRIWHEGGFVRTPAPSQKALQAIALLRDNPRMTMTECAAAVGLSQSRISEVIRLFAPDLLGDSGRFDKHGRIGKPHLSGGFEGDLF